MCSASLVSVGDDRVAVTRCGDGPPLLFLHNAGTCQQIWSAQMRHFAASHTVVALDFPGYGRSDPPTRDYTLDYCTDVAEGVVDALGLDDVVLIGNCIGAATALRLTARRPGTVRAVLAINVLTAQTAAPGLLGPLAALGVHVPAARRTAASVAEHLRLPRWLARLYVRAQIADTVQADDAIIEHLVERWQQPTNTASLLRLRTDTFGMPRRQPGWPPVHLAWGERNRILPIRGATTVDDTLQADSCQILSGTGHLPMVEHAGEVISAIEELLAAAPSL
jgi:pimeloyl-ACP methyl ester carboxylesterase